MEFKDLTVDEANLIVQALAKLPFETVVALIQKLQAQGKAQLDAQKQEPQGAKGLQDVM